MNLSPTLPTTLRQIASEYITGTDTVSRGDRGYLLDTADNIEAGTATLEDVEDAAAIASEYTEHSVKVEA
jgi:hypothetical protein